MNVTHSEGGGFGTSIGGLCSLITSLVFLVFTMLQLYTWIFLPNYNQQINFNYNPLKGSPKYDMPPKLFLPAYAILDGNIITEDFVYNDPNTWNAEWKQRVPDGNGS